MNILARHLFTNLLKPLVYLLLTFLLLFIIGDLMDHAGDFLGAKTSALTMLHYYALMLPSLVVIVVPLCLLLATLYSLSMLTRNSEIVAMRASGISIYRIIRPYLAMGWIGFLLTALVNEYTGPRCAYRARQLYESEKRATDDVYYEQIPYKNPALGHSWYIEGFDTRTYAMQGITLRKLRPDGSDDLKITAKKGMWMDGRWWFQDGAIQQFNAENKLQGEPETFQIREMRELTEQPEDFLREAKDTDHQTSLELWDYIQTHQYLSHETLTNKTVDLHHKLSLPFICLIATLIGIPVGAHTGRKGALAGIMMAIAMFFGFYGMQFSMEYLAKQMIIPPWSGPWTAVATFFVVGNIMIFRMR